MLDMVTSSSVVFAFGIGPTEMVIAGIIAVLLFGSRLPEVARSLGKSFVEFKKGVRGIEEEVNAATYSTTSYETPDRHDPEVDDRDQPTAPKFEPPSAEPQVEKPAESSAGPKEA